MRSLYATFTLASLLAAAPLAGAYASMSDDGYTPPAPLAASVSHEQVILGQLNSVTDGIVADRDSGKLTVSQANSLTADARSIRKATMTAAAENHGQIPTAQYDQLLQRIAAISDQVNPVKMD
ncbi:hypothetical protein ASD64_01665 [Mesorhizobium sp. Root157]|uniref:hypothetical protein n=1 Tax=Mesorhizobium sp. Root157 TaxID=1736477 RepID=UPI0006F892E5|nr:hypothetical protein [Mesorhizobium sp. Root157]KRA00307.1 hypothetical protein ASD64_01665 [Mesorhizobium sp. Root157]